jgi:hypothetical protein
MANDPVSQQPGTTAANPVTKSKRGKSTEQRLHDKAHDFSVVQVTLNTLKNDDFQAGTWSAVKDMLEEVAGVVSQISHEAYLFAEYHLRRLLNGREALPEINQSLFRSCLSALSDSGRPIKSDALRVSFEQYRGLRPHNLATPSTQYMSGVLASLSRDMFTATKNHISLCLVSRLARYVRLRYNVESTALAKQFMWMPFDPQYGPEHLVEHQQHFKDWIQLNPYDSKIVENNLAHFLRKMMDILDYYESLPLGTQGVRGFTILPKKGQLTPGFFLIDPCTLPELLKKLDQPSQLTIIDAMVTKLENQPPAVVLHGEVPRLRAILAERRVAQTKFAAKDQQDRSFSQLLWRTLFNVAKYETSTRKFALKLSTNAYAVSVYLQKPKPANPPVNDEYHGLAEARDKFNNGGCDLIIGLDPGRSYPVSTFRGEVDIGEEGTERSFCPQISTKEWRHDAKIKDQEQWEVRMRRKFPEYGTAIQALPSLKVGNFATFTNNVRLTLVQSPFLLRHHAEKRKYREYRFKISRFSKKALAKAARKLTKKRNPQPGERRDCHPPSRTIIGWGDWSQQDGFLRGTPKAPVKKFRRAFKKMGFTILEIDEYRTSKCCSSCGHVTENLHYGGARCHQVVRCGNSECEVVWQRDCNAARNMRAILLTMLHDQPRPVALRRGNV